MLGSGHSLIDVVRAKGARPVSGLNMGKWILVAVCLCAVLLPGCSSLNTLETTHFQTGIEKGERPRTQWGLNLFMFGIRYGQERFTHWGPIFPYLPGFPLLCFEWEKDRRFSAQDESSWKVRFPGPGLPILFGAMSNMGAEPGAPGTPKRKGQSGFTTPIFSSYEGNIRTLIVGPPWLYLLRNDQIKNRKIDYTSYRFLCGALELETNRPVPNVALPEHAEGTIFRILGIKPRFLYFLLGKDDFVVPFLWWLFDRNPRDPGYKDYPVYCAYRKMNFGFFVRNLLTTVTLGAFPHPETHAGLKDPWHWPGTPGEGGIQLLYAEDFLKPGFDLRWLGPGFFNKFRDGLWYLTYSRWQGWLYMLTGGNAKMFIEADQSYIDTGNPLNQFEPMWRNVYGDEGKDTTDAK